ncbi:hypothetical protein GQ53DRAFT_743347 [Thozetella sp. PMI_491]|nr:hypothetical protein GQ53DRAFT_743347 [Thozetella sp. PMI_491]
MRYVASASKLVGHAGLLLALLGIPGRATAESSSVVEIFNPQFFPGRVYASVIAADTTATQYAIECGPAADEPYYSTVPPASIPSPGPYCDQYKSVTITAGPSTLAVWMGYPGYFTRSFDCQRLEASVMTCDFFLDGQNALETGHFPWNVNGTEYSEDIQPLTITAGLEKLLLASATTTSGAVGTSASATPASIIANSSGASPTYSAPATTLVAPNSAPVTLGGGIAAKLMLANIGLVAVLYFG